MPELPEVERARQTIAEAALERPIVDVDDTDTYVCRPHLPGDIRGALLGRRLTAAHRRGKTMWCDTSAPDGHRAGRSRPAAGPTLGIHLGMAGRIVVTEPDGRTAEGGDPRPRNADSHPRWNRFTLRFADGATMVLLDPRRLGRVRLDPIVDVLGPDALSVTPGQFRAALARGTAPVKARLLDQTSVAGIGNLLADEALWQARINPATAVSALTRTDVDRLQRAVRRSVDAAVRNGGVHTGRVIPARTRGGLCPRCRAEMRHATVGGRSTWWCPREQVR